MNTTKIKRDERCIISKSAVCYLFHSAFFVLTSIIQLRPPSVYFVYFKYTENVHSAHCASPPKNAEQQLTMSAK